MKGFYIKPVRNLQAERIFMWIKNPFLIHLVYVLYDHIGKMHPATQTTKLTIRTLKVSILFVAEGNQSKRTFL